jgi:hypothetical protein
VVLMTWRAAPQTTVAYGIGLPEESRTWPLTEDVPCADRGPDAVVGDADVGGAGVCVPWPPIGAAIATMHEDAQTSASAYRRCHQVLRAGAGWLLMATSDIDHKGTLQPVGRVPTSGESIPR